MAVKIHSLDTSSTERGSAGEVFQRRNRQTGGSVIPQHKFKVKLIGQEGSSVAALKPPFDVVESSNAKDAFR